MKNPLARSGIQGFWGLCLVLLGLGLSLLLGQDRQGLGRLGGQALVSRDTPMIMSDEAALYRYVKAYGGSQTISYLASLVPQYGECHTAAHKAGRYAYEIFKDRAFQAHAPECHSGYYHGSLEAYFKEKGTANLTKDLQTICRASLNPFYSHQCIHGVGHGLMAWTGYELNEALASCDKLAERRDSCWSGVFMENVVGGLAPTEDHRSKYLSDDPHYPCNAVGEGYKSTCYFLQTDRMIQLWGTDFAKIAQGCLEAPAPFQRSCFESMGRDVGGVYRRNPEGAIAACAPAPPGEARTGCLVGAAQDAFWDPSGQDTAVRFCQLLPDTGEKAACYGIIVARAPEVISRGREIKAFCAKLEAAFQVSCLEQVH